MTFYQRVRPALKSKPVYSVGQVVEQKMGDDGGNIGLRGKI
jgi:hypothetical protein